MKNLMNTDVMRNTLHESEAGRLTFPQVVQALAAVGVESYFADLAGATDNFYLTTGESHAEKMTLPAAVKIAEEFSHAGLKAAIRAVQGDEIRYPEFLRRAMAAGTTAYWVFITGRKVIYFGRKGDFHIEEFPGSKT
jgi:uncharacterized protein YbcV (DUF1398 family)